MSHNHTNNTHQLEYHFVDTFFFFVILVIVIFLCCNCIRRIRIVNQPVPIYVNYDIYGSLNGYINDSDSDTDERIYKPLPDEIIDDECCICQEKLYNSTTIKLDCNHYFHEKCYKEWNRNNNGCCLCRKESKIEEYYLSIENMS